MAEIRRFITEEERSAYRAGIKNARNLAHSLTALEGQTLESFVKMLDILIAAGEESTNEPA